MSVVITYVKLLKVKGTHNNMVSEPIEVLVVITYVKLLKVKGTHNRINH
ncbi:hypothetical protein [Empedobacter falsenii]